MDALYDLMSDLVAGKLKGVKPGSAEAKRIQKTLNREYEAGREATCSDFDLESVVRSADKRRKMISQFREWGYSEECFGSISDSSHACIYIARSLGLNSDRYGKPDVISHKAGPRVRQELHDIDFDYPDDGVVVWTIRSVGAKTIEAYHDFGWTDLYERWRRADILPMGQTAWQTRALFERTKKSTDKIDALVRRFCDGMGFKYDAVRRDDEAVAKLRELVAVVDPKSK